MAYLTVGNGLEEYLAKLGNLAQKSEDVCGEAAEAGGAVVADAIRTELDAVPTDETYSHGETMRKGPRAIEKVGLQNSFGVAPVQNRNGYVNVKVGFDGYNKLGEPNPMIARSVVKGTSFMKKNDFVNKGVRKSREKAEETMRVTVDEKIYAIMENDK